jgi:Concanavalin A-like lectin/glucanases superfamily
MMNKRMFFIFSELLLLTTGSWVLAQDEVLHGLVLCNTLGSQDEIENSVVGPNGLYHGGSFVPGMFGNAYAAQHDENLLVEFPSASFPAPAGTVEFWAKLIDFPPTTGYGGWHPAFVWSTAANYPALRYVGNDGHGGGGLSGTMHSVSTATGGYKNYWSYAEILGAGQEAVWHHYALVWDRDGIPEAGNHMIAIYLDGELNSGYWIGTDFNEIGPGIALLSSSLNQGSVAIDSLRVWNYPKTDFADRTLPPCSQLVDIDIKPGSDPNNINPLSKGVIPVAILSIDNFDATQVDASSVEFGPNGAKETHGQGHVADVDGDDIPDMMFHFKTQETGIQCTDTEATLTGETFGGEKFTGTDSIQTVGCK